MPADHAVAITSYDEPGHVWSGALCSCQWEGPLRVSREQAVLDAARHLLSPERAVFGDDWHQVIGAERERRYREFRHLVDGS